MRRWIVAILTLVCLVCNGCGDANVDSEEKTELISEENSRLVIGFSQLGAESDWRNANSDSMKQTFCEENGYELIFDDAQQKQVNQITAIRNFIQQEVDYIILAPVTETGWDTVLQEAKEADIPVIIVDRMVDVEDQSLYTCWVGSDFYLEGQKAVAWLNTFLEKRGITPDQVHIANIQGTIGASAQIGRTKALENGVKKYGWDLLAEETGDYTQTKGREVMASYLEKYENINVVYCENDNEAFGAIEAIEAAGRKVGYDITNGEIMILSFDGGKAAMQEALDGKIACVTECNPLHGPRVQGIIRTLEAGGTPKKATYAEEGIFSSIESIKTIQIDDESYDVTLLSEDVIEKRAS